MTDFNAIGNPLDNNAIDNNQRIKKSKLGQEDFLKLLTVQMSNQDPMSPDGPGEFLGQMAQFGTVDGIGRLNKSVESLSQLFNANQALQASSLVGRNVQIASPIGVLRQNDGLHAAVNVDGHVNNLSVAIKNAQGEVVKQMFLGDQPQGITEFTWDGTRDDGTPCQPGRYQLVAEGISGGAHVALGTMVTTNVDSVTLGQGGSESVLLNLGELGSVSINNVNKIG